MAKLMTAAEIAQHFNESEDVKYPAAFGCCSTLLETAMNALLDIQEALKTKDGALKAAAAAATAVDGLKTYFTEVPEEAGMEVYKKTAQNLF